MLRNAAIPFFSLLFTEAIGLLVLATFVTEVLFGIEGFGLLLLRAVADRDLPVLLGGTVVVIAVGVVGNVVRTSRTATSTRGSRWDEVRPRRG